MADTRVAVDRLERYTQFLQNITITLATVVLTALAYDKASNAVRVGEAASLLFTASLVFFLTSGLAGGRIAAELSVAGDPPLADVLSRRTPLVVLGHAALLRLPLSAWRGLQHWGLLLAILTAGAGALATEESFASGVSIDSIRPAETNFPHAEPIEHGP